MNRFSLKQAFMVGAISSIALLAGCAAKAPPPAPPPPPPPPVVIVIPPMPTPPRGAAGNIAVPAVGPDGIRQTINAHLTPAQTTWNLRSALNVAALNCLKPEHSDILVGYKVLLKNHTKALVAANKVVDSEFRQKYGSGYVVPRERYMTQVYNYFALPPTREAFCNASVAVARELPLIKKGELDSFAVRSLPQLESVYDAFFRDYEKYRRDLAAWQAQYAPQQAAPYVPQSAMAATVPGPSAGGSTGLYGPSVTPKR